MLCAQGESYQDTTGFEGAKGEPKLDGWRCIIEYEEGKVRVYGGRNAEEYTGRVPYIEDELADKLPPGTILDGEMVSTIDFGMVQSIMSTHEPHKPSKERPALKFYLFDVLKLAGTDIRKLTYESRRIYVEQFGGQMQYLEPTLLLPVTPESLELVLTAGFEGLVVKSPTSSYHHGRSGAWKKIKPRKSSDGKIIGFRQGEADGRWGGKVGAFEVELLENGIVTTIKCKNDAMHEDATAHPENWLGQIIEFKHNGLMKSGKPRHPMFHRVRGDLMPVPAPAAL
jgi:ATP-dependent DNA ligase